MSQAHNIYDYGSTGIPVPSVLAGKNVNESYLAWKNFSPLVLSSTVVTQLSNCPCGQVKILNPLGNDVVYVGGLPGSNDDPYLVPNNPGLGRGTPVFPGTSVVFQVVNSNLLSVIASRNGDIITWQTLLSQSNFITPTADPPANPVVIPYVPRVFNLGIPEPHLSVSDVLAGHKFHSKSIAQSITVSDAVVKKAIKPRTIADTSSGTVTESVGVVHMTLQSVYNVAAGAGSTPSCSPAPGAGYACGVDTAGFYAYGETASVANGLTSGPVQQVIVTKMKSNAAPATVSVIIVDSSNTLQYTFVPTVVVSTTPQTNVTFTDAANTYTMNVGDAIMIRTTGGGTNPLFVGNNVGGPFGSATEFNGSSFATPNGASPDLAAQIFCFF